jgi:hypothetical protein
MRMPPKDYSQQATGADVAMTIVVDGVRYPFRLKDISASIELELYNQSGGLRLTKVIEEVVDGAAGFHIAALVFLARRAQGDEVTFSEVAGSMGLTSDIEVIVDGDDQEDGDRPEVSAAG